MAEAEMTNNETKARSGKKKILFLGGIFLLEAALIVGVMKVLSGPTEVEAAHEVAHEEVVAEDEKIVELLVLDEHLPNSRQGISYIYDTEIWVHVKKKHEARVTEELERFHNEIKSEMMALWRAAEPRHLQEPRMESMTRQVESLLRERFGDDSDSGDAIIEKCVIVPGPPLRLNG